MHTGEVRFDYKGSTVAVTGAAGGITVNAICPGYVYTDMYENGAAEIIKKIPFLEGKSAKEMVAFFAEMNCAMKRVQTVADVANAAMFLASDGADNITGVVLDVSRC